jgi:hypothetical protein
LWRHGGRKKKESEVAQCQAQRMLPHVALLADITADTPSPTSLLMNWDSLLTPLAFLIV